MKRRLAVTAGNNTLATFAGSELWTYTLVSELQRIGHSVSAYSPDLGAVAAKLETNGIRCTSSLETISDECDVIICSHHDITVELRRRFPNVPIVAVVHGVAHVDPHTGTKLPEHPVTDFSVDHYVSVSEEVRDSLRHQFGVPSTVVRNFFDLKRFAWHSGPVEAAPRSILINCNYSRHQDAHVRVVREVAAHYGAQLRTIGAGFQEVGWNVEAAIHASDVVIGMGRSVMEGFCMGKIAVVHGRWGTGGVITADTYDVLKQTNFSGRNSGGRWASAPELIQQIDDAITRRQSFWQRRIVSKNHDVRDAAKTLLNIASTRSQGAVSRDVEHLA